MPHLLNEGLKKSALNLCKRIAGSRRIVASCFYGPWVCGYADEKSALNVLLVLDGFPLLLGSYTDSLNGINAFFLTVDRRAFERDVEKGWLGEFVAEKVTVPYETLINEQYLSRQEVRMKRRVVLELLKNIVLEFPELSRELLIAAKYFMHEAMMRRARLFPPITYSFLNILRKDVRKKNVNLMMKGYTEAISQLAKENKITFSDGYVKITERHLTAIKSQKPRLPLFLVSIQRAALLHILSLVSRNLGFLMQDQRIFMEAHRNVKDEGLVFRLEEPKKFLFMPTSLGPVALSEKPTIEDFVRKTFPGGKVMDVKIEEMGGVLNEVYLLKLKRNDEEEKFVVKRFRDWSDFKWFALALWAIGTKAFAVLGGSRLEREYATNQFLYSHGFPVPKVLYVSPQERLIFEEFIEGEKMVEVIKRIVLSKGNLAKEIAIVRDVGRRIAEAHRLSVALGDCKPENIIVTKDSKTFFLDLEQATRHGDQAWDVAEFLYYSGHYVPPISSAEAAKVIAKNFVEGYLEAGGKKETVNKAKSARYVKVFSVFTPPHVILAISDTCKGM